jgi:hypothetical protein
MGPRDITCPHVTTTRDHTQIFHTMLYVTLYTRNFDHYVSKVLT